MYKKSKKFFYVEYTLLFLILAGSIYYFYHTQGKTMIDYGGDGFRQHFRALLYYSNYLKQIFSDLLHGKLIPLQYSFSIGEGSDILEALHYYCIGDIFAFFSVFCPEKYMHYYYDFSVFLRMYCSGLAFAFLCFYKKKDNLNAVLIGSLLYAFCSFSISSMTGHVFFISAVVFLPLIILGVEKIINNDKPYLFVVAVALSSLSNIYFFYMNALSTALFVIVRLLFIDKDNKEKINLLLRITVYSILGLGISMIVFLPMAKAMFSSSRLETSVNTDILFPLKDYYFMFKSLTFKDDYVGGFGILWIFALSNLFFKNKNKTLTTLLIVSILFLCIPYLSSIYNAMAYPTDRWVYAVSLLVLYIVVEMLCSLETMNDNFFINMILSFVYYGICAYIDNTNWRIHILFLLISLMVLVLIKNNKNKKVGELLIVSVVFICLLFQNFYIFSPKYWGLFRQGTDIKIIENMKNDEHSIFNSIKDDSFFRYTGNKLTENESIQGNNYSTQYYWSVVNDNVVSFRKEYAYSDKSVHHYNNYDDRFTQNALAGVKYYIDNNSVVIPYGFDYYQIINGYKVYKSNYNLPLIYAYDNYMNIDNWSKLSLIEKSEALVQTAVIEEDINAIESSDIIKESIEVYYNLSHSNDIEVDSNSIRVKGNDAYLYLECENDVPGEYYVVVEGLYSNKATAYITARYGNFEKYFIFKGSDNKHYTDRHDYIVNLGYLENFKDTISLDFSDGGTYEYGSIKVICQPLDYQIECLEKLKDITISDLEIRDNTVIADVTVADNKLACFSIPYSKGWNAYVDGKKVDILKCNIQYMAIETEKGSHHIELKYSNPYMNIGLVISIISCLTFVYLIIINKNVNVKIK